jgi:hypothetical protein
MTELPERTIVKLKTRPISKQDSISILNENLSCRSSLQGYILDRDRIIA